MAGVSEILGGDLGCGRKAVVAKEKILEGSKGLSWGSIQTVTWPWSETVLSACVSLPGLFIRCL